MVGQMTQKYQTLMYSEIAETNNTKCRLLVPLTTCCTCCQLSIYIFLMTHGKHELAGNFLLDQRLGETCYILKVCFLVLLSSFP